MTDAEIIRAWEKALATGDAPIGEHRGCSVTTKLAKETVDMLTRQKAEIERLTEGCKIQAKYIDHLEQTEKFVENEKAKAKSEARKEFVKKFEKKIKDVKFTLGQTWEIQCALKGVLEEMEGEGNV